MGVERKKMVATELQRPSPEEFLNLIRRQTRQAQGLSSLGGRRGEDVCDAA